MRFVVSHAIVPLAAALLLSGCGDASGTKPTGTVAGTVKYNMQPVANVDVNFVSPDTGGSAKVAVSPTGEFKIAESIPAGKYKVYLSAPPPQPGSVDGSPPTVVPPPSVPDIYLKVETTDLTADVKAGSNKIDLVLK